MNSSSTSQNGPRSPGGPFSGKACPVIVGPTAVGKTGLVTALAERHPIEVISLDSRQIYHGLRIGTAQPTPAELAICPHHLIDFISPAEKYDAIRFRNDFESAYADITARGRKPVLVGGAGMYLTAIRDGFMKIPGSSPDRLAEVREKLEQESDGEIRARLKEVDPISFRRIHGNDRYRSQRALEIFDISGRSMTSLQEEQEPDSSLGLEFPTFVLERPVEELDRRIAQRTEQMLEEGWIQETETALASFPGKCPGLMSIGYREIVLYLQGELTREELDSRIILVTRQYAKRQRTWFRQVQGQAAFAPESSLLLEGIGRVLES